MPKERARRWVLLVLALLLGLGVGSMAGAAPNPDKPAIVLTAFGTSTAAFDTYKHLEDQVKQRFPGYDIRWAFTSRQVRQKVWQEQQKELQDLPQTLKDLKAAGYTRVAVQSLHVVPGEEWEEMVKESRAVPGLQVALGQPLLSSKADQIWVLTALAKTFPKDLQKNAVVLVGHGSPSPQGAATYAAFERLVRSRYPDKNVFFGVVEGKPTKAAALAAVRQSGVCEVVFIPFLLVAGEHVNKDILGDEPDSWKSQLLKSGSYRVQGVRKGLGYQEGVARLYLDHLDEALKTLNK
jgi:sirohydrochlorin cobaltochelatase